MFLTALLVTFWGSIEVLAQQKIKDGSASGQNLPNGDALLELESLNKGFLNVRLGLKNSLDPSPLKKHTAGMMVYNLVESEDVVPGMYYNDGSKWILLGGHIGNGTETVTVLANNGDGTYIYTSEDGTQTSIDIPGDVIQNFETILNDPDVRNVIANLMQSHNGNVYYDGFRFSYLNEGGELHTISFQDIVRAHETLTTLFDNGDGTFTYTNEKNETISFDANTTRFSQNADGAYVFSNDNGESVTIDVLNEVIKNINEQGNVYDEIVRAVEEGETLTELSYESGSRTLIFKDENNVTTEINLGSGSLSYDDQNHIITYVPAHGVPVKLDLNDTDLSYEAANNLLVYVNSRGERQEVDLSSLAVTNETLTFLKDNGNGRFSYTDEEGNEWKFDANTTQVEEHDGVYTFRDAKGEIITIIDLNASSIRFDSAQTTSQVTDVQQALQELFAITGVQDTYSGEAPVKIVEENPGNVNISGGKDYKISIDHAQGTQPGIVKEATENPTVTINNEGELSINMENINAIKQVDVDYTVLDMDKTILVNAQARDLEITLPDPSGWKGKELIIKKQDANENTYVNISGNIAETNGQNLYTGVPFTGWSLISDGNQWQVINKL